MDDRKLLKLAAKAAGIDAVWFDELQAFVTNETPNDEWNPLTDDGDALRLAVKLRLEIIHLSDGVEVSSFDNKIYEAEYTTEGEDPYAATRRAIVRAAAEIGRSME